MVAGTRTLPPASLPSATGAIPLATATALPLLDPPGILEGSHGFTGVPQCGFTPVGWMPNSCMLVLANTTAPAARRRWISGASWTAGSVRNLVPLVEGSPATSMQSFTATGTPSRGPRGRPCEKRPRAASASACAAGTRQRIDLSSFPRSAAASARPSARTGSSLPSRNPR